MSPTAPYEALASMIELELALVSARDFPGLARLAERRDALIAELPDTPPPVARVTLERCARLQRRVTDELERVRGSLLAELEQVSRGHRTARGYADTRPAVRRVSLGV